MLAASRQSCLDQLDQLDVPFLPPPLFSGLLGKLWPNQIYDFVVRASLYRRTRLLGRSHV